MGGVINTCRTIDKGIALGRLGGRAGRWVDQQASANFSEYLCAIGLPIALLADTIPVIARATTASLDEAGLQPRDEEAAAAQRTPHEKRLLNERILRVIEEDVTALASLSLPPGV